MFYRTLLPFILAICQYSMSLECAYINVSFSATNIAVNGSFEITLIGVFPNEAAVIPSLACGYIDAGRIVGFAKYNFFVKKFQLWLPLPVKFAGRIKIRSDKTAAIVPVRISDENHEFGCTFDYHDSSGTKYTLRSHRTTIENVYDLPVFASSLQTVYTAIEGIPKPITCSVKSRPASNITWSHDAEVVGVETQNVIRDGDYFITTGTFTIEKPLYSMRGKNIFCTGKPKFGAPIKQNTTLNVLYRPRNTVFTVTPSKLAFNTNIQLSCNAVGIPGTRNYRFYVNGNLIGNKTDGKLTANVSPINCVTYAGEYKCVPESTVGDGEMKTATREFDSSVTLNASKVVNEAQEVTLSCSAKGCPTSEITWKKNGISLAGKTGSKLHLLSVTKTDSGEYSCHATFWNKTKSAKMTLTVNHKPDNVQFTTHTLEPKNGEEVVLRCSSDGLPAPSYSIYKIDGSSSSLIASSSSHSIASINYVDYTGYKATFRCESKNILGNATKDLQLDIQVEPVFSLTVTPNIIMENQSTRIECKVTAANPPATTTLRGPNNSTVPLVNGTTRLTNVKRESNGIFSCTAANSGRPSPETKTANLIVQYQPDTVTFGSSSLTPVTGSRMTLTCTSNGVPAPSYKIESISGTSTKIIRDTTSGTYSIASINYANYVNYRVTFRCTPRNTIGSASKKEVTVNIQVAPVLVISKEKKIEEGREASFSCNVTAANPATTVRWKNPSDEQIQHSNGFIKVKTKGTYTCLAKNSVAESKQTVELVVTGIKPPVAGKSSSAGIIGGVIGGLLVLVIIAALIYFFVIKGSPLICGSKTRLVHEQIWKNEDQYVPMEGIAGETKNKNVQANAPEESPRVNGSDSKEPIVPAQGDEYPHKYTVRYQLPDGTQYATVATRGKADIPGVTGANVTVIDEDTDADNSKKESQYAEIAAFNLRGNIRSPSDIPERTEYATLEECGPIAKHPPTSENENVAQIMGTPTEI